MRNFFNFFLLVSFLSLTACAEKAVCPPSGEDKPYLSLAELESRVTPQVESSPTEVTIGGKQIMVDKVVVGPLCNDEWKGIVYVGCDVQVLAWDETPLFLKDCDLSIEPGTVTYVAYHNDAPYYNGCSCHTGDLP